MSKEKEKKRFIDICAPESECYIAVNDMQLVCLSSLMSLSEACVHASDIVSSFDFLDCPYDDIYNLFYRRIKYLDRDLRKYFQRFDCGR